MRLDLDPNGGFGWVYSVYFDDSLSFCPVFSTNSTSGATNKGGGGGGGHTASYSLASPGGSGVVILRVTTNDYSGTSTGSPTVTTDGDYKVVKFSDDGSYTS